MPAGILGNHKMNYIIAGTLAGVCLKMN